MKKTGFAVTLRKLVGSSSRFVLITIILFGLESRSHSVHRILSLASIPSISVFCVLALEDNGCYRSEPNVILVTKLECQGQSSLDCLRHPSLCSIISSLKTPIQASLPSGPDSRGSPRLDQRVFLASLTQH
ncbi:hypothetical protein NEOLEDRAFT_1133640 [Neolentinus lepideus HHB14362 ss-1]|uniref:Uncharacterized protein n=1 Tax=Neolentinus lepideus HHB14362 ss-1 TaxID=1314782 RepID=A0A165SK99_9AGAM|nr:hypothetical protein NEOLEDRAFT_1133640 [Neolentinus lepideus HHB14362 ss-1]